MQVSLRTLLYLNMLMVLPIGAAIAAPPDAGSLLKEQQQPGAILPDRLPGEQEKEIQKPPLTDTGVKVVIKGFTFSGGAAIATDAELQALVAGSIGKELGLPDLQKLAAVVTDFLREKGYPLAKAYLPKQDVTGGVVEIAIVAGRVDGRPRVNVKEPRRISQKLLQGIVDRNLPAGDAIRMEHLERATLLINDLPGMSAHANLEAGETPGTTRVDINATEGPLLSGVISGDNYGDRYTGAWRGMGQVAVNDPLGQGDRLNLILTGSEHMYQGRAAYVIPLGATGFNLSASYTGLAYKLGKELENLQAKGWADTFSAGASYPLLRSRNASLWSNLGFDYLLLRDDTNGTRTSERKIPVGSASLTGSFYDRFGGGGLTSTNISLGGGKVDLSGVSAAEAADEAGPKTSGSFVLASYSLARLQRLSRPLSLYLSARGQFSGGNLDSSQKFILGGPNGVRAYPVGEGSGDEGHSFTLETRFDFPAMPAWATTQLVGFLDNGWVKLHHDTWVGAITNATGRNSYWLSGAGVGLVVGKPGTYSIRASYAHTLGDNPGRTVTGNNNDNRSNDDRGWLQALVWF